MFNSMCCQSVESDYDRLKRFFNRLAFYANEVDDKYSVDHWHANGALFLSELSALVFPEGHNTPDLGAGLQYVLRYLQLNQIAIYQLDEMGKYSLSYREGTSEIRMPLVVDHIPEMLVLEKAGCFLHEKNGASNVEPFFQPFSSAWLFPLSKQNVGQGFILFGCCLNQRTWYGIEFEQLLLTTGLIARSLEQLADLEGTKFFGVFGEMMYRVSKIFSGKATFDGQISTILSETGVLFGAHRNYIFEIDDPVHVSNSFEWVDENQLVFQNRFQRLVFDDVFPGWRKVLADGQHVFQEAGVGVLNVSGQKSSVNSLVFPIFLKGEFYGFIGFDFPLSRVVNTQDAVFSSIELLARIVEGLLELKYSAEYVSSLNDELQQFNDRLLRSEQLVNGIVSAAPMGIFLIQGRQIVYANDYITTNASKFGLSLLGSHIGDFDKYIGGDQRKLLDQFYGEIETLGRATIRLNISNMSGGGFIVDLVGAQGPVVDGGVSYVLVCQDVTESVAVQERIQEANTRYQTILDKNPDGVLVFSSRMRLCYINPSAISFFGYSFQELQQHSIVSFFSGSLVMKRIWQIIQVINQGNDYKGELDLVTRDGSKLMVEIKVTRIVLNGLPHFYVCLHNITERKLREEQLRISENKYRALIENSRDCMIRMALDGQVLFINSAAQSIFSQSTGLVTFPDEVKLSFLNNLRLVAKTGCANSFEMDFPVESGNVVLEWSVIPEFGDSSVAETVLFVGRDCSARRQSENALKGAMEKMELADRLKSAFLNNLSHEIRTPLNAVVGFSSFLREDNLGLDDRNLYVDIIHSNAEALMSLIDDIVDVAKLESGSLQFVSEPVNLNALFRKLEKQYGTKLLGEKKDLEFTCQYGGNGSLVMLGDSHRLLQAVSKLLDNAFKFTTSGFVSFGYESQESGIVIFVKDSGIGINIEDHAIIFDSFRQCENSTVKQFEGTGVGLYIARKLVEAMGGQITFKSERNKGSEFYITFPIDRSIPDTSIGKAQEVDTLPVNLAVFKNKLILLAIDDSSERLMIRRYLENTGASIISVRSVYSALQLLKNRNDIDWLVVDHAASSNGALRLIDSQYKNNNGGGKLVLISTDCELTERDVSADLILQKPFDKQVFVSRLSQLV